MTADIHAQKILILDFGSQYTQLIARRVREVVRVRACDQFASRLGFLEDIEHFAIILCMGRTAHEKGGDDGQTCTEQLLTH